MKRLHWVGWVAAVLIGLTSCAGADEKAPAPSPLKTTTDKIKYLKTEVEFKLVQLPPGKVTIRDTEGKEVQVDVKPIWIGQYEVRWDEYDVFWEMRDLNEQQKVGAIAAKSRPSKPYRPPDRDWGREGSPAGSMFCKEAKRYCEWLSKQTGHKYRLPTEAEWEYACRAGGAALKPETAELKKVAWYADNSGDQSHPVGEKAPNAWGLYDMLGNVAEWVVQLDGKEAVAGGSWQDDGENVHSGAREFYNNAKWQKNDPQIPQGSSWLSDGGHVGFRVVREVEKQD